MIEKLRQNRFLFSELVKRDFKQKYKRTTLGMAWSILNPLLTLLIMRLVFTQFFGRSTPHYTTYLFCGTLLWNIFTESTLGGMNSLTSNASIITKIKVPKYLFLFSKNVSALINFGLTLVVFFLFCVIDRITFTPYMLLMVYPIVCVAVFNVGMGLILSACYVFFRDTEYLYSVLLTLLQYLSAIFYTVDNFSEQVQQLFYLNPMYVYITFLRTVVIHAQLPSVKCFVLAALYVAAAFGGGCLIYKKFNHQFLYYV